VAVWSKVTGAIAAIGIGRAGAIAIEPALEPQRQAAWQASQARIFGLNELADLVAQALITIDAAADEAERNGYARDKIEAAAQRAMVAPPSSEAQDLRRRGKITREQLLHSFAKAKIEPQYWEALAELVDERLSPQFVAAAVQRGVLPNPGLLPVGPPAGAGKVPPMPVVPLDPVEEAAASGYDFDRLAALTRIVGLPPGPGELLDLLNRGTIEEVDYYRGISEGNTRNEWAPFLLQLQHKLVSADVLTNLRLKGWIDRGEQLPLGARIGYSGAELDRMYLAAGRPAAPGQMYTAVARAVDGPDGRPMDLAQFTKGIQESNIRPEWAPMLWGIRHTYPPLFQTNRLVQAKAVTPELGLEWLHKSRYAPDVLAAFEAYWAQGPGTAEDTHVGKARNQLWATLHASYKVGETDDTRAGELLTLIEVPAGAQPAVLELWQAERSIVRRQLTPAQLKKEYRASKATQDETVARLVEQGYSTADAVAFLEL